MNRSSIGRSAGKGATHYLAELEEKKEAARNHLEKLKSVGASAWADFRSRMTAAVEDLGHSRRRALSRLP